jgi:hypothetical protein
MQLTSIVLSHVAPRQDNKSVLVQQMPRSRRQSLFPLREWLYVEMDTRSRQAGSGSAIASDSEWLNRRTKNLVVLDCSARLARFSVGTNGCTVSALWCHSCRAGARSSPTRTNMWSRSALSDPKITRDFASPSAVAAGCSAFYALKRRTRIFEYKGSVVLAKTEQVRR